MAEPKYPNIEVELSGQDGNAFMILGRVQRMMRRGDVPAEEITAFVNEATEGDYNHLISTVGKWVSIS
ncbi:hypothetical protein SEA_PLATTE_100 [Microbacterium phage Platte]|nr:hypothetical protein SEA_HORTUS1_101 [Microbacterium phage Hortus1]AWY05671.1 hypothetical protein SEA_OLINDD_101 [Microbacterium phage OlinDD]AWY05924.1 hypothetical protein SEA_PIONEER3_101 [Microbacterium phage Pioneer3]AWY06430.1 hypothetical protein SEA_TANDEM_101 [Microbacterium phage Tandem]QZD97692.1 hypothetical protein SEA_PLATTE_100 [Microbacterium phage Platte]